jgi:hypothetical protein
LIPKAADPVGLGHMTCDIVYTAPPRPPCPAANPTVLVATLTIY